MENPVKNFIGIPKKRLADQIAEANALLVKENKAPHIEVQISALIHKLNRGIQLLESYNKKWVDYINDIKDEETQKNAKSEYENFINEPDSFIAVIGEAFGVITSLEILLSQPEPGGAWEDMASRNPGNPGYGAWANFSRSAWIGPSDTSIDSTQRAKQNEPLLSPIPAERGKIWLPEILDLKLVICPKNALKIGRIAENV
ncbi:hypothetical protein DdX_15898 [Ditylenchus destructor]|uniref:Uncharacterized protein n=1 Tax=Ditylenchus destructor TaxID=166010 RepID=A0AAD4MNU1_9BILA|nr:hypothetical protein DdX_15898 [Ditylenchus destructor]